MSVSQFNHAVERYLTKNNEFVDIHIKGEISDVSLSSTGHLYFTLKDDLSSLPCVIFYRVRRKLKFDLEIGMEVIVDGKINVYWKKGKYQFEVSSITEVGLGDLYVAYDQLKKKLKSEGLFDSCFKKDLPVYPKKIGVVTSRNGAVIRDIIKTVEENWPYCNVILFPSSVQGDLAKNELVRQIKRADNFALDVLIVGRGGGSVEDLWCFNEEEVVRAIFKCKTPVISAIGHEDDTTLCDLASDKIASTPTKAAFLAIEDKSKIKNDVLQYNSRLIKFIDSKLNMNRKRFGFVLDKSVVNNPYEFHISKKRDFDNTFVKFNYFSNELINLSRSDLNTIKQSYVIRNPCKIQFVDLSNKLSLLLDRLVKAMDKKLNDNRRDFDNLLQSNVFKNPSVICHVKKDSLNKLMLRFESSSNEIFLIKSHRFDSVRNSSVFRNQLDNYRFDLKKQLDDDCFRLRYNFGLIVKTKRNDLFNAVNKKYLKQPDLFFNSKKGEFKSVINSKIVRNPYLLLDSNKTRLDNLDEKLDNINQVNILRQDKQRQMLMYKRVMAIIVVVIIVLLIIILNIYL